MNTYLIKFKIATVSELVQDFNLDGYNFSSYSDEWWSCNAWVATKKIEATSAGIARNIFLTNLIPLIYKFSVASQCAFRTIANSYLIYRLTDNPDKIIYIYFAKEVSHTGLHFDKHEFEQLSKLDSIENKKGMFYMAEAANSTTFFSRLSMLIAAVEGFAGETTKKNKIQTNIDVIKEILGDELYNKLYAYGTGLRHKLLHGNIPEQSLFDGLNEKIYICLREYLRTKFDVQLETNVVDPQRNFYGNHIYASAFETLVDEKYLELKLVEEAFDDDNAERHNISKVIFGEYPKDTENY